MLFVDIKVLNNDRVFYKLCVLFGGNFWRYIEVSVNYFYEVVFVYWVYGYSFCSIFFWEYVFIYRVLV